MARIEGTEPLSALARRLGFSPDPLIRPAVIFPTTIESGLFRFGHPETDSACDPSVDLL
jgi:hypothetical protein